MTILVGIIYTVFWLAAFAFVVMAIINRISIYRENKRQQRMRDWEDSETAYNRMMEIREAIKNKEARDEADKIAAKEYEDIIRAMELLDELDKDKREKSDDVR